MVAQGWWFFREMAGACLVPSVVQGVQATWCLLLLCLLVRLVCLLRVPEWSKHTCSLVAGFYILSHFFALNIIWVVLLSLKCYVVLFLCRHQRHRGIFLSITTLIYLLIGEMHMVDALNWHRMRGAQMLVVMKAVSLAFDIDSGRLERLPSPVQFMGYIYFIGTVVFGPWISFEQYLQTLNGKKMELRWIKKVVLSLLNSMGCLVVSTCVAPYIFPFVIPVYTKRLLNRKGEKRKRIRSLLPRWLNAYQTALSFHFSNYFVGFLAECSCTLAGGGYSDYKDHVQWDLAVSKPMNIELPRSMVDVVSSWNIPMSSWLNRYVFKNSLQLGKLPAILLTYGASALLHGLSFHLGAVLLSLGLVTYTEHVLRRKIATVLNACVLSRKCTQCEHQHKSEVWVMLINLSFTFLAIFHLAYLGALFDGDGDEEEGYGMRHTIDKWTELGWAGHWLTLTCWLIHKLL
uniref:protein-serine O-palmitoleoyltransferase porcupine n=1 Tax=Myxine glutinosa TaxID=7769 RepID=UPI00358EB508